MLTVDSTRHPALFELCLTILHDVGALNRIETAHWNQTTLSLPEPLALHGFTVDDAESAVARLTPEERETFAIGEETEMLTLVTQTLAFLPCTRACPCGSTRACLVAPPDAPGPRMRRFRDDHHGS